MACIEFVKFAFVAIRQLVLPSVLADGFMGA